MDLLNYSHFFLIPVLILIKVVACLVLQLVNNNLSQLFHNVVPVIYDWKKYCSRFVKVFDWLSFSSNK
jgi:uncharacterized protein involved in cysteine biosynthesis